MPTPVDWKIAAKVATKVAGREPFAESYHWDSLEPDFAEFTAEAEELVAQATGLRSREGRARARVTDRAGWISANVASFQRLLRPLTDKIGSKLDGRPLTPVARGLAGAELGALLGWMSTRVLGQYDLLIIEDEDPEDQDIVYYVGPNILALEKRFAFPPREFRLWLALHEVTHRVQFTGIEWMRPHFLSLVEQTVDSVDPDPQRFLEALKRMTESLRQGRKPLDDGGLAVLFAGPEQRVVLDRVSGLMSLLEGHGDVTMDRAGADLIPNADRFGRVLRARRRQAKGPARLMQRMLGFEAKLSQYEQGEQFIAAVEASGGSALLNRAWETPDHLPTLVEIREPGLWIERVAKVRAFDRSSV